jgi:hypothetical protein
VQSFVLFIIGWIIGLFSIVIMLVMVLITRSLFVSFVMAIHFTSGPAGPRWRNPFKRKNRASIIMLYLMFMIVIIVVGVVILQLLKHGVLVHIMKIFSGRISTTQNCSSLHIGSLHSSLHGRARWRPWLVLGERLALATTSAGTTHDHLINRPVKNLDRGPVLLSELWSRTKLASN